MSELITVSLVEQRSKEPRIIRYGEPFKLFPNVAFESPDKFTQGYKEDFLLDLGSRQIPFSAEADFWLYGRAHFTNPSEPRPLVFLRRVFEVAQDRVCLVSFGMSKSMMTTRENLLSGRIGEARMGGTDTFPSQAEGYVPSCLLMRFNNGGLWVAQPSVSGSHQHGDRNITRRKDSYERFVQVGTGELTDFVQDGHPNQALARRVRDQEFEDTTSLVVSSTSQLEGIHSVLLPLYERQIINT